MLKWLKRLMCRWFGHQPGDVECVLFGYPATMERCRRCGALLHPTTGEAME